MTTPDPQQRRAWMEHHLTLAAEHFGATLIGHPIHTDRNHSVGAQVSTAHGTRQTTGDTGAWLRLVCDDPEWADGNSYLTGNLSANNIRNVPKPSITQWHEWKDNGYTLRGELSTYIPDESISHGMVLTTEPNLTDAWLVLQP